MKINKTNINKISQEIFQAEENHKPIKPLTDRYKEITIEDAYKIQMKLIKLKQDKKNIKIIGSKIGLTGKKLRKQMGTDEPDFGYILEDAIHEEFKPMNINDLIVPCIEAELAFILNKEIKGPGITIADVINAIEGVIPSFEIVDSRFGDWKINIQDTIADNASNAKIVLGSKMIKINKLNLESIGLVLYKNGGVIETSAGARVLGNPLNAIYWLANKFDKFNRTLKKGDIILSGSFTPLNKINKGDYFEAKFDNAGKVSLKIDN